MTIGKCAGDKESIHIILQNNIGTKCFIQSCVAGNSHFWFVQNGPVWQPLTISFGTEFNNDFNVQILSLC